MTALPPPPVPVPPPPSPKRSWRVNQTELLFAIGMAALFLFIGLSMGWF